MQRYKYICIVVQYMEKLNLQRIVQNKWMDGLPQTGKICITIWPSTWNHVSIPLPRSHQDSSNAKIRNITFNMVVDSYVINYTGKYNFLHNDYVNKSHSVNTKNAIEEKKNRSIHLYIIPRLNGAEHMAHHKINFSSTTKCTSQYQEINLHNLQG